jgi:Kef-type K+ transport system membrane component KefB
VDDITGWCILAYIVVVIRSESSSKPLWITIGGALAFVLIMLVVATAIAGKFGGTMFAARLSGVPWRDATAVGILMNTRGLMELIALNIGLDIGVISQTVFTIMVMMALVTTLMTSPLLEWVYPAKLMLIHEEENDSARRVA